MTTQIEERLENNLYLEMENVLTEMTTDITNHILNELVNSPLNDIYKKYEAQSPLINKNNMKLEESIQNLTEATKEIKNNLSIIIPDIIKEVIERNVFTKINELFTKFESEIPKLQTQSLKLDEVTKQIEETEQSLKSNIQSIVSDVSITVIKDTVMKEYRGLYNSFEGLLPRIQTSEEKLEKSISAFNKADAILRSDLVQITKLITEKVSQVINAQLSDIFQIYENQLIKLEQQISKVDVITSNLSKLKKTFDEQTLEVVGKINSLEARMNDSTAELKRKIVDIEKKQTVRSEGLLHRINMFSSIILVILLLILFFKG